MTCEGNVCGTGGWSGPKPGDPSNDLNLVATPAYGGIDLTYTFPTTNPHAIAYVVVFRGMSADFNGAIPIGQDTDGFYHDRVEPGVTYYYWVQMVSINGTFADVLGPASAAAMPTIEQVMIDLTARIDEGLLAQTLRDKIDSITANHAAIMQEIEDRLAANTALQTALASVEGKADQAMTYIVDETTNRSTADQALTNQLNVLATGLNENKAAITEEATVRSTKHDSLASTVNTLFVSGNAGHAAIMNERTVWQAGDKVNADAITALSGRVGTAEGAITDITNLNISSSSALATKLTTLTTGVGEAKAATTDLNTALSNGTHALASKVTTVESTVNGNSATGQVGLTTKVNNVTGALDTMYYAKVQANGLVGGFGIWNNGTEVQAGFDVDMFWVGRTGPDKIKPFIIDGGVVYINEAAINKLTFSKLRADDGSLIVQGGKVKAQFLQVENAQSANYAAGSVGWSLKPDGSAELNNVTIRGNGNFQGMAQRSDGVNYVNFPATGTDIFLKVGNNIILRADGSGYFARTLVSAPNIVASGQRSGSWAAWTTDVNTGAVIPGFTVYIDTGVNVSASWAQAAEDMYIASATISSGVSTGGGVTGYSEVSVVIGDGLASSWGSVVDSRIYIKYEFNAPGAGSGGNFTAYTIDWKLVRA